MAGDLGGDGAEDGLGIAALERVVRPGRRQRTSAAPDGAACGGPSARRTKESTKVFAIWLNTGAMTFSSKGLENV